MSLGVGPLNPEGILWSSLQSRHASGSKGTVPSRSGGKKWVYGRAGQRPRMEWERASAANPSESVPSAANPSESVPSVANPSESVPAEATESRVAFGFGVRPMASWPGHRKPGGRGSRGQAGRRARGRGAGTASALPARLLAPFALGEEAVCVGAGVREGSRVLLNCLWLPRTAQENDFAI